ncbi:thioredoxin domain-containing protein [Patescibacteria group bacterium]|nr:thioredoxin domain-containing protein [Patescibacteria group bacterium]
MLKLDRIQKRDLLLIVVLLVSLGTLGLTVYNNYTLNKKISLLTVAPGGTPVSVKGLIKKIDPLSPRIGNPNAKVVIVEFEDFQCPFCKKFDIETFPEIKKEFIDTNKILYIHVDLAILGLESNAAAEASHCAADQNKFWEFREYLYTHQAPENSGALNAISLKKMAKTLGLDTSLFNTCFDSGKYKSLVVENTNFAKSYGFTGTPSFVINEQTFKGARPLSTFIDAINQALK